MSDRFSTPELLTASDLATRLGIRPATVYEWYRKRRIPGRKLSPKVLRFDLADVLAKLAPSAEREVGQ